MAVGTARRQDLYERELARYRETIRIDVEAALDRYGMTLIHSLSPAERVLALKEMGNEITNPADYYNLGHMYGSQENWDEAITYFRKAIELDAQMTDAIYNLAACYERANLIPQAKSTWQTLLETTDDKELKAKLKAHIASL